MKTTVTINLGGFIFHIDDDAYEVLHSYLIALERQFANETDYKEILSDIESRLAELFTDALANKKDVISKEDVAKVISIMGEPQDFTTDDNQSNQSTRRTMSSYQSVKRLYRDPDNRVLGGVCGGLGAYLNADPLLFRIIFIVLFLAGSVGFWIYIILWIAVPEANTTAQKLEMRGEPVTIENIKRAVREEFETVKKNMKL